MTISHTIANKEKNKTTSYNSSDDRETIRNRYDDHMKNNPSLNEVLNAFEPSELYLYKSRRSHWLLKWNQENNRYLDDTLWGQAPYEGGLSNAALVVFEQLGVDVR